MNEQSAHYLYSLQYIHRCLFDDSASSHHRAYKTENEGKVCAGLSALLEHRVRICLCNSKTPMLTI